ncbi:hypothetical protein [Alloalcanivorax mobilis]|uniref:hypothetical protein n=1 Tax=Alloalcanivorax mobilis TaxID=2019569 RepID=UPI000B5B0F66|nr:hypothetical protein [Alloalcanivorax mobilis]ASK33829.1 hypothetical protein CEK62_05195 [Alcanivorax sp. N3-2A]
MKTALPAWLAPWIDVLEPWLPVLTLTGVVMAIVSTLAIPWMVVRMPQDYFNRRRRPTGLRGPLAWLVWALRNALAVLLLVAGILMLVLPGQGLLTLLIALMVSTFPGKYRLERAIMRRRSVLRAVNWIRRRYHRPPLNPIQQQERAPDAD